MDKNKNITNQIDGTESEILRCKESEMESAETKPVETEASESKTETSKSEKTESAEPETAEPETAEPEKEEFGDKVHKAKEKKKKSGGGFGFIGGLVAGILLCAAAAILYKGYIYFPVGDNGEIIIKFPYYEVLHGNRETGTLDEIDIKRKTDEITDLIDRNYLYEQNPQRISDGMFTGLIYGLTGDDVYAAYYSANNYETEKKELKGSYVGIGVSVTKDETTGGVLVGAVNQGGPAEAAGLLEGDIIIAADDKELTALTLTECIELISGEEGTTVRLKIKRGDEELELDVKRETIKTESVRYQIIPKTNIGYLSISSFTPTTEQDYYAAFDELSQNKQVDGIIIDLRNNSGGDMNVALRMVDSILEDDLGEDGKTLLVKTEDKNGKQESYYAEDGVSEKIPVVILVNGKSASASEIFSGVLKDYGYEVIGTKTFGKGIVQSIYQLSDGSAIKFTTDYYLLPNGERIHGEGIEPTVEVEFEAYGEVNEENVNYADGKTKPDFEYDKQLRAALDNISEQLYS